MIKDSEYTMPFGKHKGQLLCHVPADYLLWFVKQDWAKQSWPELYEYCFKNRGILKEEALAGYDDDDEYAYLDAPVGCDGWGQMGKGRRMITRVFLDMDGVLCDFMGGVLQLFNLEPAEVYKSWPRGEYDFAKVLNVSKNEVWKRINSAGPNFWTNLQPCAEMELLLEMLKRHHLPFTVLTSPSLDPGCAEGKIRWLQKIFGRHFRDYFVGPQKELLAAPGRLLIDDCDKNVDKFLDAGGDAIPWPRPWNRCAGLNGLELFYESL